jgi:hypothetical protein
MKISLKVVWHLLILSLSQPVFSQRFQFNHLYQKQSLLIDSAFDNTVLINAPESFGPSPFNRGTGVYLGFFQQQHVFVTNAHVLNQENCQGARVTMLLSKKRTLTFECHKVIVSFYRKDFSDMTLFTVKNFRPDLVKARGENLELSYRPQRGEEVFYVGMGQPSRSFSDSSRAQRELEKFSPELVGGKKCFITSADGQLVTSDDLKASSIFATGCTALAGDSGAVLRRWSDGKAIGLVFAARLDRDYTFEELNFASLHQRPLIWRSGTFVLTLEKIKEYLL